jgi:predicted nucleic acid-binding protein
VIVVDTNTLVYALTPGPRHRTVQEVLQRDSHWVAPRLWRSEFRNVLASDMRRGNLALEGALELADRAETVLGDGDYEVSTPEVLDLCRRSGCTAYDAEFVSLALSLGVPLVTGDRRVLDAFPGLAVTPEAFVKRGR